MFELLAIPASFVFMPLVIAGVLGTMVGSEESVILTVPKWRKMKEVVSQGYKLPTRAVMEQFFYNAIIWAVIIIAVINTESYNWFVLAFALMSCISSAFKYKHRHRFSFLPNWTIYHSLRYCALILGLIVGITSTISALPN